MLLPVLILNAMDFRSPPMTAFIRKTSFSSSTESDLGVRAGEEFLYSLDISGLVFLGVVGDEKHAAEEVIYAAEQQFLLPREFKI